MSNSLDDFITKRDKKSEKDKEKAALTKMSGKISPAQVQVAVRNFYGGESSPPKRTRLLDSSNSRPAIKDHTDNLIKSDHKISGPIKGPEELDRQPAQPPASCVSPVEHETTQDHVGRKSPVPLKNLGNTCYENSIIQCLFSLDTFMKDFEESMQRARKIVANPIKVPQSDISSSSGLNEEVQDQEECQNTVTESNESNVRFKVADAFEKLYKTYVRARNQTGRPISNNVSTGINLGQIDQQPQSKPHNWMDVGPTNQTVVPPDTAISLCKPCEPLGPEDDNIGSSNENQPSPIKSLKVQRETPIALISSSISETATLSATSRNEQSEIENRLEDLKSAVGERSAQFNSTHQQDASEFFYHVIDSIQEFYQGLPELTDDDNPVTKAFELELDHLIRCPKCHNSHMLPSEKHRTLPLPLPHVNTDNNRAECSEETNGAPTPPTSDLGLDSPESNVSDDNKNTSDSDEIPPTLDLEQNSKNSLDTPKNETPIHLERQPTQNKQLNQSKIQSSQPKQYTLSDALNNYFKDDLLDYTCSQPGCNSKQRTKRCLIRKLPQVLFLSLARYSYTCKKSLEEIEAPFELTVPFRENRSPAHSPSAHRDINEEDHKYQLVAVVCHLGSSLNAGHYTSYVYNQKNNSWFWCDDDSITEVQESDVAKDANKNGYCFFYSRKSCINNATPSPNPQALVNTTTTFNDRDAVRPSSILDSSVVMTPEASPTSSPTPSVGFLNETTVHKDHRSCASNTDDLDDWS